MYPSLYITVPLCRNSWGKSISLLGDLQLLNTWYYIWLDVPHYTVFLISLLLSDLWMFYRLNTSTDLVECKKYTNVDNIYHVNIIQSLSCCIITNVLWDENVVWSFHPFPRTSGSSAVSIYFFNDLTSPESARDYRNWHGLRHVIFTAYSVFYVLTRVCPFIHHEQFPGRHK